MTESNYWVGTYVSPSSPERSTIHQASKDFDIDLSGSVDWNPEIEVTVARNDKFSIQVPKSSKYHKVKRIQEADFLQFFNQTLHYLQHLDLTGGEYYIDTNDFAESYSFEAYFEKPHINLSMYINHGIGLMLEFCHDRGAYTKFQDTLFAQFKALVCNDKPSVPNVVLSPILRPNRGHRQALTTSNKRQKTRKMQLFQHFSCFVFVPRFFAISWTIFGPRRA